MNVSDVRILKNRFNNLPTMWDGEASWCVTIGPVGAAIVNGKVAAICCLWFYPPREIEKSRHRLVFEVIAPDQETVNTVISELGRARHALEAQMALIKLEKVGIVANRHLDPWLTGMIDGY
jgi:hypothetical protein